MRDLICKLQPMITIGCHVKGQVPAITGTRRTFNRADGTCGKLIASFGLFFLFSFFFELYEYPFHIY